MGSLITVRVIIPTGWWQAMKKQHGGQVVNTSRFSRNAIVYLSVVYYLMNEFKDIIKTTIALATLIGNAFIIYLLLYDPLAQLLINRNQPYNFPESNTLMHAATLIIIALLILTFFLLLLKIKKEYKLFIPAPVLTLTVVVALVVASLTAPASPNSTVGYTEGSYHYIIEIWWNKPDQQIYKRWKSVSPYDGKSDVQQLKYTLDSLSDTKGN